MDSEREMFLKYGIKDFEMVIAIFDDLTYFKSQDINTVTDSRPNLVARRIIHGTAPILSDPNRPRFSYEIFDKDFNKCKIRCADWVIQEISEYYYAGVWYSDLVIISPESIMRRLTVEDLSDKYDLKSRNLEAVVAYQKYINSFKSYIDWTYFDLSMENESLKKEIASLKIQLEKKGE